MARRIVPTVTRRIEMPMMGLFLSTEKATTKWFTLRNVSESANCSLDVHSLLLLFFFLKKKSPTCSNVKIEEIVKKIETRRTCEGRGSGNVLLRRRRTLPLDAARNGDVMGAVWRNEPQKERLKMKERDREKERKNEKAREKKAEERGERQSGFVSVFFIFYFLFRPTMSRQWVKDAHASSSASSTRSSVTSFSSSSSSPFFHVRLPALILSGAVHCDPHRFFLRWFFFFHQDLRAFLLIVGFITRSGLVLHASRFSSRMEYLDLNRFMSSFCFYWKSSK